MGIKHNIENINTLKAEAALKVGRNPDDVALIAVSKTYGAELINQAIEAGATDIGESKVQEILEKHDHIRPVRWHMIGHLQTNKVKYIIDKVSMIHSVDSMRLAQEINLRAGKINKVMDILVQVNPAREESKFGIASEDAEALVASIHKSCPNIRVCGLMSLVPYEEDPENVRGYFRQVKEIFDLIKGKNIAGMDFKYLSMGMSHDFQIAIEEGANMIRVGTAIFGVRDYSK